jgi:hypothetical protein
MKYFSTPEECSEAIIEVEHLSDDDIVGFKKLAVKRIIDFYNWGRIAQDYYNALIKIC